MSIESKDYGLWVEIRKIFQPTLWDKIKSILVLLVEKMDYLNSSLKKTQPRILM